jgi:mono/diheme cytochrome c family protein
MKKDTLIHLMKYPAPFLFIAVLAFFSSAFAVIPPEQIKQLPPAVTHPIDFTKEIKPILENSCVNCHGHGRDKGGFKMDTRETLLAGGDSGDAIVVGNSAQSYLVHLVAGTDPDSIMPKKGTKLTPAQVGLVRAWIDQGAKWDEGVWLGKVESKNLNPHSPNIPANKNFSNPIDAVVDAYFRTNKVQWPEPVSDRVFARRVYLDVIGLIPPANELEKFVSDKSADKRQRLVKKLLSDNRNYAEHWMTFWNDMLRNDYKGTGYIDGGRKQITKWLFNALATNMPYNQFVAELINPTPESEGFTKGIVWRGVVNASQVPPMQAAQNVSQVFMGINLKCASCHDSFISDWQLSDSYGLANIYADQPLEIALCDKLTGKKAATKFLYPEFGEVDPAADKSTRLKQLAECVTSPKNGRLSRTFVNRLWGRFFGHALVEPVDDMDQLAWSPDLLDFLAEDFVAHKYDVHHLIEQILTSRAYDLPAVNLGENVKEYVFAGPSVRRLSAEQFRDALTTLTGIGYANPLAQLDADTKAQAKFTPPVEPKWIWNQADADKKAKAERVYFRKTFQLSTVPTEATVVIGCDNSFKLYVNGKAAGSGDDYSHPVVFDIRQYLKKGENLVAVEAINHLPGNQIPTPKTAVAGTENPAGLIFYARIRGNANRAKIMDIASDSSWMWSNVEKTGWEKPQFVSTDWSRSAELGNLAMQPWRMRRDFIPNKLAADHPGTVRAALVAADPLMVALGRPNREQVVTTRSAEATMLQALEMTNGETLYDILKRGAANLVGSAKNNRDLIQKIYEQALGRKPSSEELAMAEELVGAPVKKEGVEDLLWATAMRPEFQLIY